MPPKTYSCSKYFPPTKWMLCGGGSVTTKILLVVYTNCFLNYNSYIGTFALPLLPLIDLFPDFTGLALSSFQVSAQMPSP